MSSPAEFYKSLPPISKAYGTLCLLATTACQFGLYHPADIALIYELVFSRFQVWRLITNFFFLGKFSINFGIRLLMIARYGVQLESGPFQRRTADFLWMMIFGASSLLVLSAIPFLWSPFLGISLVFMLLYVWSREFPNANINIYGLVTLKAFYLPWAMLALDVIFGSPLLPDLLGIIAGHLYYFLTVLHPLAGDINWLQDWEWELRQVTVTSLTGQLVWLSGGDLTDLMDDIAFFVSLTGIGHLVLGPVWGSFYTQVDMFLRRCLKRRSFEYWHGKRDLTDWYWN